MARLDLMVADRQRPCRKDGAGCKSKYLVLNQAFGLAAADWAIRPAIYEPAPIQVTLFQGGFFLPSSYVKKIHHHHKITHPVRERIMTIIILGSDYISLTIEMKGVVHHA
ncbi:hypothetical protein LJK87_00575 [Paenibacillus sp. P25]|nr:hypothetical protein LJK87_00575 [Paenibacillus sp. P25]